MSDKAVITCALNGVLTDPKQHHVPVTPEEMAREARAAFDAGASVMHIHLRQQARDVFEIRYQETVDPDKDRWELCSRVLSRRDVVEKLSTPW